MFRTPLTLRADPTPCQWIVAEPLVWEDAVYGRLVIPAGFRTDLASTPFHIDDDGASRRGAAMHDALYKLGRRLGKPFADAFLRDAIKAEGGGRMRAQAYYYAVRWFGLSSWASDGRPVTIADFETPAALRAWIDSDKTMCNLTYPKGS